MTEAARAPSGKRKRRWTRTSLRGLLILLAILGAILGPWASSARQQRGAVAEIETLGGTVKYKEDTLWPGWLVDRVGVHYFCSVIEADFSGFRWSRIQRSGGIDVDRVAAAVAELPSCRSLTLHLIGLRDEDLQKLHPLAHKIETLSLREIDSDYARGAGLVHLKDWSRLKSLLINLDSFKDMDLSLSLIHI